MKVLLEVEVDEMTAIAYESLSTDTKEDFKLDVTQMMQNRAGSGRGARIKQLLDEIKKDAGAGTELNPEILYELLRRRVRIAQKHNSFI